MAKRPITQMVTDTAEDRYRSYGKGMQQATKMAAISKVYKLMRYIVPLQRTIGRDGIRHKEVITDKDYQRFWIKEGKRKKNLMPKILHYGAMMKDPETAKAGGTGNPVGRL